MKLNALLALAFAAGAIAVPVASTINREERRDIAILPESSGIVTRENEDEKLVWRYAVDLAEAFPDNKAHIIDPADKEIAVNKASQASAKVA
ncbi:MAG: hypothetical protein GOMPHAMPRED_001581 [Gomphillus americanus]|uniref:Uncharacterized protein n=1 Tax=Gomphillus americanus TaxID=1940652 RepID=A0A8H3F7Q2_9LECA|nr:MAG: hypothetical protein GOMPHAMPRED_001581 [Gomphillus americanus]